MSDDVANTLDRMICVWWLNAAIKYGIKSEQQMSISHNEITNSFHSLIDSKNGQRESIDLSTKKNPAKKKQFNLCFLYLVNFRDTFSH